MASGFGLLRDGAADGPWNMAVDALLLERAMRGTATLRFYTWRGSWLSLGYAQRLNGPRREACREAGVGLVRRVTGGRAVLHGADLTYAVAGPVSSLPGGLEASYGLVAEALLSALRSLGIAAERSRAGDPRSAGPRGQLSRSARHGSAFDCFAEPAPEEICAGGRKLCGSAQRRSSGALLQHGSLRVGPDPAEVRAAALGGADPATSLAELGFEGRIDAVQEACVAAFAAALGPFTPAALGPADRDRARRLAATGPAVAHA